MDAYSQAVPALSDRLMTLQAQHEQLERTQAELVAQHEVSSVAGASSRPTLFGMASAHANRAWW